MIYLTMFTPGNILIVGRDFPTNEACEAKLAELKSKERSSVVAFTKGECQKRNVDEGFALQLMPDEIH
jgi:hypothetical protein